MIKNTKESDFPPGEEGNKTNDPSEIQKLVPATKASSSTTPTTTSSSTPWLRLKDPRIVRVSRVFGGKDRHSKVCTIRGLRDRRVRLSVPTAIQLYDLQDRLGLNQPSKVVDWLLNAAKHEIDELPPLPIPPGSFALLMPRDVNNNASTSQSSHAKNIVHSGTCGDHDHSTNIEWDQLGHNSSKLSWSNFWCTSTTTTARTNKDVIEKENLRVGNEGQDHQGSDDMVIGNNFLQKTNMINMINNHQHPFFPGMLSSVANNGGYRWEAPNYPLLVSNLGGGLTDHNNLYNFNNNNNSSTNSNSNNIVSLVQPSTLSLLSTGSQFLQGSSASTTSATTSSIIATQTYFPNPQVHMLSSSSAQTLLSNPMRSLFHFGMSNNSNTNDNGNTTSQQSEEGE